MGRPGISPPHPFRPSASGTKHTPNEPVGSASLFNQTIDLSFIVLSWSPSFLHILSHRRLKIGQTNRPMIIARSESRTPRRLLGDGPIMLANSRLDSIESSQRAKSLLATPAIIPRATFSAEGNRFSSSAIDPVVPSNRLVNLGFSFCSSRNAGEIKFEGNAQ